MNFSSDPNQLSHAHRGMLIGGLRSIFGELNDEMLQHVLPKIEWVGLNSGDILFRQHERDDSLYFVISGRLRAHAINPEGEQNTIGEIARGETVGEMAFFTGEPRSATVVSVRDSVLARFKPDVFRELLIAYPLISLNMTRLIIERHKRASQGRTHQIKPVTIGIAAITEGLDLQAFCGRLADTLKVHGKTIAVSSRDIGEWLGDPLAAQVPLNNADASRLVAAKLEEVERDHQFVLLVADPAASEWTCRCLRLCDQVLLVADASRAPAPHPIERRCLNADADRGHINRTLVLLHPAELRSPGGTRHWLNGRNLNAHVHIRPDVPRDWSRLGRILGGKAVGLVLSGGGARGFAHLGVMRALEEANLEFDMVGGTSVGAVMGSYASMDLPMREVVSLVREAFRANPTGDFNLVPMISLISGRRLREVIDGAVVNARGHGIDIEDLWKNFFCVSCNYSAASENVITRGPLAKSVRASVSIPGVLPPVMLGGELNIDGSTFNNFPADVMSRMGAARIIGVNLLRDRNIKYELDEVPGSMALLLDKLMGRRNRLPLLTSLLLNTSMMYSYALLKDTLRYVDLYFAPSVHRYGILEWEQFDRIVQSGYDYAREVLDQADLDGFADMGGGCLPAEGPAESRQLS